MTTIRKGLDVPISGEPAQRIEAARPVRSVALIGRDYNGMKPTMAVQVGDRVKLGQIVFSDKRNPGVHFTAPAAGVVSAIHRGEQRVLQSLVIDVEGNEEVVFAQYPQSQLAALDAQLVRDNLIQSGLWTALRTRPLSKTPAVDAVPSSIFVTAIDTHPLAADPAVVIAEYPADFASGLQVLSRLAKVFLCKAEGVSLAGEDLPQVQGESFSGPHPAGLAGTHIHFLDPVSASKSVWSIGYQDVIAIGKLFLTGHLWVERVVALGGPVVEKPRLLRSRLGANLEELCAGELVPGYNRVISGSVLGGRTARGAFAYLGRFHQQVSCLHEGDERQFLHYLRAGVNKHSVLNVFVSRFMGARKLDLDTSTNGSTRAMVSVGTY